MRLLNSSSLFHNHIIIFRQIIFYVTDICRAAGVGVHQIDLPGKGKISDAANRILLSTAVADARALINAFIVDFDVVTVLIKAIHLSGWVFHMKVGLISSFLKWLITSLIPLQGKVYRALARLAGHSFFYDKLKKENGIPVLVYEHGLRRQAQKQRQNKRKSSLESLSSKRSQTDVYVGKIDEEEDDNDDEFTDELVVRLKRDYACIKIQACCRKFLTRQRHIRLMELLGKLKTGGVIYAA